MKSSTAFPPPPPLKKTQTYHLWTISRNLQREDEKEREREPLVLKLIIILLLLQLRSAHHDTTGSDSKSPQIPSISHLERNETNIRKAPPGHDPPFQRHHFLNPLSNHNSICLPTSPPPPLLIPCLAGDPTRCTDPSHRAELSSDTKQEASTPFHHRGHVIIDPSTADLTLGRPPPALHIRHSSLLIIQFICSIISRHTFKSIFCFACPSVLNNQHLFLFVPLWTCNLVI